MADPCRQEGTIATLSANDLRLFDVLGRIEKNQERFIEVLEQIAAQGERITHLEGDVQRNEKDVNSLFGRVRDLEIEPGKQGKAVWIGAVMAAISVVISVMVNKVFK